MARVPVPARTLLPRRRIDLRGALTRDFPLKAAAVVAAIIFSITVAANQAPAEVTLPFGARIPVERPEIPPGYVLTGQLGDVEVKLRGTETAVAGVVASDLHATLDLNTADLHRAEAQDVAVKVTVANASVRVAERSPATVSVRIEPITSRSLAVQARFANDPPAGTVAGDPAITPREARVSGAASQIARIAALYATVRFGDAATDLVSSVEPTAVDAAGATIDGLTTDPAVVQVTVPVLPTATTRTVPVVPALRGSVSAGYWLTHITVDPAVVTVRGEAKVLGSVEQVSTAAIDLNGLAGDRTFQVALVLPAPDTSLLKVAQATVTISVAVSTGTRPFPVVAVQVANLASGFVAEVDPPTISLVVAGTVPALNALTAAEVAATVDAAGKGAGVYSLDVAIRVPAGVSAQSVQPTRVTITIRAR
jgi:YbbR domain-containing protein